MGTLSYTDAVGEALQRLRGVGFEFGPNFANHAPMAAEALARMGYTDVVPGWVDRHLRSRDHYDVPERRWALSADDQSDWASALGDFRRVADWSAMFERELANEPWTGVLARWWPRLLPGMSGALTHGVIRTAHAARAVALTTGDDRPQRAELACGLGYWAARYTTRMRRVGERGDRPPEIADTLDEGIGAVAALDELIADSAGFYVHARQGFPVPLIHSITAPAAVRLVCEYLPEEQRWPSYLAARRCSVGIRAQFAAAPPSDSATLPDLPTESELVAAAVEVGDEHVIKLAEVAVRQNTLAPDPRYAAASHAATRRIGRAYR